MTTRQQRFKQIKNENPGPGSYEVIPPCEMEGSSISLYLQFIEPICNELLRLKLNRHERQSETTRHVRLRCGKGFMIRFDSVPDWSTTSYINTVHSKNEI